MTTNNKWYLVVHYPASAGVSGWISIIDCFKTRTDASNAKKCRIAELRKMFNLENMENRKLEVMNHSTLTRLMKNHVILEGKCGI